MSGDSNGDVDIQMSFIKDPVDQPETAAVSYHNFKDRFGRILTAYDDERTWWDAVTDLLNRDADFAANVSCNKVGSPEGTASVVSWNRRIDRELGPSIGERSRARSLEGPSSRPILRTRYRGCPLHIIFLPYHIK